MKSIGYLLVAVAIVFIGDSCGGPVEIDGDATGQEIFGSSGCTACHLPAEKTVGPSINEIAKAYKNNGDQMILFLKEEADPIVDPENYGAMQVNLAQTKAMSDEELQKIVDFILEQ